MNPAVLGESAHSHLASVDLGSAVRYGRPCPRRDVPHRFPIGVGLGRASLGEPATQGCLNAFLPLGSF